MRELESGWPRGWKGKYSSFYLKWSSNEGELTLGFQVQFTESFRRHDYICCLRSSEWLQSPFDRKETEAWGTFRSSPLTLFFLPPTALWWDLQPLHWDSHLRALMMSFLLSLLKIYVSCPKKKERAEILCWNGTTTHRLRAVGGSGIEGAVEMKTDSIHRKNVRRFALLVSDCLLCLWCSK